MQTNEEEKESVCTSASMCALLRVYIFEHIELAAKLLDYFLRSDKSNINQLCVCVRQFVSTCVKCVIVAKKRQKKEAVQEKIWCERLSDSH